MNNPKKGEKQEVVTLLIDRGADVNNADNEGLTPLQIAARVSLFVFVSYFLNFNSPDCYWCWNVLGRI